jgi:hypothetical protein
VAAGLPAMGSPPPSQAEPALAGAAEAEPGGGIHHRAAWYQTRAAGGSVLHRPEAEGSGCTWRLYWIARRTVHLRPDSPGSGVGVRGRARRSAPGWGEWAFAALRSPRSPDESDTRSRSAAALIASVQLADTGFPSGRSDLIARPVGHGADKAVQS